MPKRSYSAAGSYRYGFNGKENDNDVKGLGNQQDYGMRIYDTRLGRFLSVDPLTSDYPSWSPYPFAMNRPIDGVDLDGLEWQTVNANGQNVQAYSKDAADYVWAGYNSDGSAKAGTVAFANLRVGDAVWQFRSNSTGKTGSLTISSAKTPQDRIHVFIFSDNTGQWSETKNGVTKTGSYQTGYFPAYLENRDLYTNVVEQSVIGLSGLELLLKRGVNERISFGWNEAIESDGLGPVEFLIGAGELKFAGKGLGSALKGLGKLTLGKFEKKSASSFENLALGLRNNLDEFSEATGFKNYRQFTSGGFKPDEIEAAIKSGSNKLHFNLTDFTRGRYLKYSNNPTAPALGNITNWELHTIYNTPGALERTTFYKFIEGRYQIVPKPF